MFALAIVLLSAAPPEIQCGKVVAILDGDTIDVLGPDKKPVRIRLDGIDGPEKKQPFATKSRKALGDLVAGKDVRVEIKGEDRYRRRIGIGRLGECNVNVKLVSDGWAWHFVKYAKDNKELAAAEREARKAKRGLWADSKPPVAPWDWRKLSAKEREEKR
jgi:endonuclease YncB( thermonuclease family)